MPNRNTVPVDYAPPPQRGVWWKRARPGHKAVAVALVAIPLLGVTYVHAAVRYYSLTLGRAALRGLASPGSEYEQWLVTGPQWAVLVGLGGVCLTVMVAAPIEERAGRERAAWLLMLALPLSAIAYAVFHLASAPAWQAVLPP
jgi:hypothetical protein